MPLVLSRTERRKSSLDPQNQLVAAQHVDAAGAVPHTTEQAFEQCRCCRTVDQAQIVDTQALQTLSHLGHRLGPSGVPDNDDDIGAEHWLTGGAEWAPRVDHDKVGVPSCLAGDITDGTVADQPGKIGAWADDQRPAKGSTARQLCERIDSAIADSCYASVTNAL